MARYCLETLQMWFDAIGFVDEVQYFMVVNIHVHPNDVSLFVHRSGVLTFFLSLLSPPPTPYPHQPAPNQITFHLPLHRYYAMFLSKVTQSKFFNICIQMRHEKNAFK